MFRFLVNIITAGLVFFNTYNQFKSKKEDKTTKKLYDIYFNVMCIFLVLDNLLSLLLRFIPFYQVFKLLMIIWFSVPKCSGSVFIYRFYVNGCMRTYEEDLDRIIQMLKKKIQENYLKYKDYAYGKIKENKRKFASRLDTESKTKENTESPNINESEISSDSDISDVIKGEVEFSNKTDTNATSSQHSVRN